MELIFLSNMYKSYIEIEPKIIRDKEEYGEREKEVGKQVGFVEGKEVGRDEGERKKAIEMAKSMLADNMDINIVLKHTGLTTEDIVKIKKDMGLPS